MLKRTLILIAVVCLLAPNVFGLTKIVNKGGINGTVMSEQYRTGINGGSVNSMAMMNTSQEGSAGGSNAYQSTDGIIITDISQSGGARKKCGINNGYQLAEASVSGGGIQVVKGGGGFPHKGKGGGSVFQAGGVSLDLTVVNDKQGPGQQSAFAGGAGMNSQFTMTPNIMAANTSFVAGGAMAIQGGPGNGMQVSTVDASAGGSTSVNK